MKRRDFIKGVGIGLVSYGDLDFQVAIAQEKEWNIKSVTTPIIDVHTHLPPNVSLEKIIENFDKAGVEKAVVMARGGMTAEHTLNFYNRYPNRVIPFIPFQVKGWIIQDPSFIDEVKSYLDTGKFKGMGEVMLRHYSIQQRGAREINIPADSPMMKQIMVLGAKYGLPILIHMEAEERTVVELENALNYEPNAVVIWGHLGRATADTVERLLVRFPNLYYDTAALERTRPYGIERNPITEESGQLKSDWKKLFGRFPHRFMLGVDGVFPDHYENYVYVHSVIAQREILSQLAPPIAQKIAYDNTKKLLKV